MKALVKAKPEPGLWLEEVPEPEVGHNDLLVKVSKTAICGTDIHIYNWDEWSQETIPVPMTVGHEFCGVVVDAGSEVSGFQTGDRVSGEGHITCGQCRNCRAGRRHLCGHTQGIGVNRPGAFAEYLVIPAMNAYHLPDNISDEVAAILDPLGNATHTALSFDLVGEDVVITGAGPIGIMAAAIARHVGARHVVITDVNDYRLDIAERMGASRAVNVSREGLREVMAELGMAEGFDVGLEMSGNLQAHRHAGHPAGRFDHRLAPGDLQGSDPEGHLRPRDLRDLVQDDLDAAERPRDLADPDPQLPARPVRGGLPGHALRPERQGGAGLGRVREPRRGRYEGA